MANGRKGVSFFPLTVTGKLPDADAGDLVTYPARKFDGEKANEGICTGAFYTWPSPVQDGGYLILSGTYATNQTDNIPVTYKIPFKPAANETGNYIEVSQNHRYTVEITKADEYKLDFTINVADWTDEGNIDDYEPGGDADKEGFTITPVTGDMTYDKPSRTVTMSIVDGTQFTIEGNSPTGYYTTMYYENGDLAHQWLEMDPKADNMTKADVVPSTFTVKKNAAYKGTKFPIATIRFTDKITAKETIVIVQPIANPVVKCVTHTEGSSFNDNEVLLNKTSTVTDPSVTVSVFASGGSELENVPDWLKVSPASSQTLSNAPYVFTADVSDASFPNPFPADGVIITVKNSGDKSKTQDITIKMKSNVTITGSITGQAEFDNSNKVVRLYNDDNAKVTLNVNSIGGTDLVDKPNWLNVSSSGENKNTTIYTFYVANTGQTNVNQKIAFKNKIDNSIVSAEYMLYSIPKELVLSDFKSFNSYSTVNNLSNATPEFTYFPSSNSYCEFIVTSPKGITLNSSTANWAYMAIVNESTLSSGAHRATIRLSRKSSNTDATYNNLNFSQLSATIANKYTGQASKAFTIKQNQAGIVYPKSDVPANKVNGNGSYWVAGENGYQSGRGNISYSSLMSQISNNSACPSGWRVPSKNDFINLTNISDLDSSNKVNKKTSWGSYSQFRTAFNGYYYWTSDGQGRGLLTDNDGFGLWDFGQGNGGVTYRCIKNI